jgi:hypothetical protein
LGSPARPRVVMVLFDSIFSLLLAVLRPQKLFSMPLNRLEFCFGKPNSVNGLPFSIHFWFVSAEELVLVRFCVTSSALLESVSTVRSRGSDCPWGWYRS